MKHVILLIPPNNEIECYSGFKKMCEIKGWSYNYLKRQKFPFDYKDFEIHKVEVK
jgi:hypothetical protein